MILKMDPDCSVSLCYHEHCGKEGWSRVEQIRARNIFRGSVKGVSRLRTKRIVS